MVLTDNAFRVIFIPDNYYLNENKMNVQIWLHGDRRKSMYFDFLVSVFCCHLVSIY